MAIAKVKPVTPKVKPASAPPTLQSSTALMPEKKTPVAAPRKEKAGTAATAAPAITLVRARFSMPSADFERIAALKSRARGLGRPAKKNELLRAGLKALIELSNELLLSMLDDLEPAKPAKAPKAPKATKPAKPSKVGKSARPSKTARAGKTK